jgi:uncharacterized membrane protein YfcA
LDALQLAILTGVAFITGMLSAIVGMAGGITLLSVMLLFQDPLVAIPLHGAVQLVANLSRTWIQREHVDRRIVVWSSLLLLPMGFLGIAVAKQLAPELARALIGVFVLAATWFPDALLLGAHPEQVGLRRRFLLLGGAVGFLNTTIGATGPLIAPFYLNLGLPRQALIGTKAACQTFAHLAKLIVFGAAGFAFSAWLLPLALLSASTAAGTRVGSAVLDRVSEATFVKLYKLVLTGIALQLVLSELPGLLGLG